MLFLLRCILRGVTASTVVLVDFHRPVLPFSHLRGRKIGCFSFKKMYSNGRDFEYDIVNLIEH